MIVESGNIVSDNDFSVHRIITDSYECMYKGLVFVSGMKCGKESIEYIAEYMLENEDFNFHKLYGNYFIYINDLKTNKKYVFVDHSGIFKAYRYKNYISTSFLELIDHCDELNIDDLDFKHINEFLHFGFTYFDHTLLKSVKRISSDMVYIFKEGKLNELNKQITPIHAQSEINMDNFFSDLVFATTDLNISLDLTGGFDSRLILSYFQKLKAEFETAISGVEGNVDISIADKISKRIKKEFYPLFHDASNVSIKEINEIFHLTDSQVDILDYHRNHKLNKSRQSRNINLHVSGAGGELYKDMWWLHDFPFYNKKKTNLNKLYSLRIESTLFPHHVLGDKLKNYSINLRNNVIDKLKSFVLESNTSTYDNIYYMYKMRTNAAVYISIANNYLYSYAPLIEHELIKVGYHLKKRERFYNNFHRKIISENALEISRIRTTERTTTSANMLYKFVDALFYIINKGQRFLKQILRKVLHKTFLQDSPTDQDIYKHYKNSAMLKNYMNELKEIGVLNPEINSENIPKNLIGKVLTLGLLLQRLNK